MEEQSATIKSLESTISNLEELLLRKEDALSSAEEQKDVRPDGSIVGNPDADFILEQANLLYANEHQHSIGIDGWTEENNLRRVRCTRLQDTSSMSSTA